MTNDLFWSGLILVSGLVYLGVKSGKVVPSEKVFYRILFLAFLLRGSMAIFVNYSEFVFQKYNWDSFTYQKIALQILQGIPGTSSKPVQNYSWLLSRLFYLIGYAPLTSYVLSGVIGTVVVRNIYRTTELLAGRLAAILTAGIWAVMPSFVFVTSQTFRDPIIFVLVTTIIYWMVRIESGRERNPFLLGAGCVTLAVMLCQIRPHQSDITLIALATTGLVSFGWSRGKPDASRYSLVIFGILAGLLFIFNVGNCSTATHDLLKGSIKFVEQLNAHRGLSSNPKLHFASVSLEKALKEKDIQENKLVQLKQTLKAYSSGGESQSSRADLETKIAEAKTVISKADAEIRELLKKVELAKRQNLGPKGEVATTMGLASVRDQTWGEFFSRAPARVVVFLLSPFPWQTRTFFLKLAVAENLIFLSFLVAGLFCVPIFIRSRSNSRLGMARFVMAYLFFSLLAYSVSEGSVGTGYRHRMQFLWLLFIPGAAYVAAPEIDLFGRAGSRQVKRELGLDVAQANKFKFGSNWSLFLGSVDEQRIAEAQKSLSKMLKMEDLQGKTFLDVGSGSGLSSLVARRLGAKVSSFDVDAQSVACTAILRQRYMPEDPDWMIREGSALDAQYLSSLGKFDIVYSWGVLHHTGVMWQALENVIIPVKSNGLLFVAIYNDQGWISSYWHEVKRIYNHNAVLRAIVTLFHAPYLIGARFLVRAVQGRLKVERGMSLWYDMLDWLGGWPFETATNESVIRFYEERGFRLLNHRSAGRRHGCNEFVFERVS